MTEQEKARWNAVNGASVATLVEQARAKHGWPLEDHMWEDIVFSAAHRAVMADAAIRRLSALREQLAEMDEPGKVAP